MGECQDSADLNSQVMGGTANPPITNQQSSVCRPMQESNSVSRQSLLTDPFSPDLGECQDTSNLNPLVMGGPESTPITKSTTRCQQTCAGLGKPGKRPDSAVNFDRLYSSTMNLCVLFRDFSHTQVVGAAAPKSWQF